MPIGETYHSGTSTASAAGGAPCLGSGRVDTVTIVVQPQPAAADRRLLPPHRAIGRDSSRSGPHPWRLPARRVGARSLPQGRDQTLDVLAVPRVSPTILQQAPGGVQRRLQRSGRYARGLSGRPLDPGYPSHSERVVGRPAGPSRSYKVSEIGDPEGERRLQRAGPAAEPGRRGRKRGRRWTDLALWPR